MRTPARRVLALVGATSSLGRAFARMCEARGVDYTRVSVAGLCRNPREMLASELGKRRPWAVINATGMQQAPDPERGRRGSRTEQRLAWHLASACSNLGLPLLTFSSDLVFDGGLGRPYAESDAARPVCPAGSMKLEAEKSVQEIWPDALILRAGACFGSGNSRNFLTRILAQLAAGRAVALDDQRVISPTYMPDLVHAALDLLIDGERGLWHVANAGAVSWYGLATDLSDRARTSTGLVRPLRGTAINTALRSERGVILPSWQEALARFVEDGPVPPSRTVCARNAA